MRKRVILGSVVAGLLVATVFLLPAGTGASSGVHRIIGYAWSQNGGWIKFGPDSGGAVFDYATGKLSGHAWSENLGWIKLQPDGLAGAQIISQRDGFRTGDKVTGWIRALAPINATAPSFPNNASQAGGWDGKVSMSDPSGSKYAVTFQSDGSGDKFSGYGWGDLVLGWVDFSQVYIEDEPCVPGEEGCCPNGSCDSSANNWSCTVSSDGRYWSVLRNGIIPSSEYECRWKQALTWGSPTSDFGCDETVKSDTGDTVTPVWVRPYDASGNALTNPIRCDTEDQLRISCSVSANKVKLGESVTMTVNVDEGDRPFVYQFFLDGQRKEDPTQYDRDVPFTIQTAPMQLLTVGQHRLSAEVTDSAHSQPVTCTQYVEVENPTFIMNPLNCDEVSNLTFGGLPVCRIKVDITKIGDFDQLLGDVSTGVTYDVGFSDGVPRPAQFSVTKGLPKYYPPPPIGRFNGEPSVAGLNIPDEVTFDVKFLNRALIDGLNKYGGNHDIELQATASGVETQLFKVRLYYYHPFTESQ